MLQTWITAEAICQVNRRTLKKCRNVSQVNAARCCISLGGVDADWGERNFRLKKGFRGIIYQDHGGDRDQAPRQTTHIPSKSGTGIRQIRGPEKDNACLTPSTADRGAALVPKVPWKQDHRE
jgi:hypothetical protein